MTELSLKVSNSEALSLQCVRKWMYAFHPGYHLEPVYQSVALARGLAGHSALEAYFRGVMEGKTKSECETAAKLSLGESMAKAMKDGHLNLITAITELIPIIDEYMDSTGLAEFLDQVIILGVEVGFDLQLPGGSVLPGRSDLVVKYVKGQWKGETVIVDNKFVYNFWSEEDFRMNSQIPGYITGFRDKYPDAVIRRGVINQLRHRSNAQERFTMTEIKFEKPEMLEILHNHELLADRVLELRALPLQEVQKKATRTLSKYTCGTCGFKSLCKTEMQGGNARALIKMDYRENSYGYDGVDDSD